MVSNTVMHYRVSVYNYFWARFREEGWDFSVITNKLQKQNRIPPRFALTEVAFNFLHYRRHIRSLRPETNSTHFRNP